jgi:hypothetical protein
MRDDQGKRRARYGKRLSKPQTVARGVVGRIHIVMRKLEVRVNRGEILAAPATQSRVNVDPDIALGPRSLLK